MKEGTLGFEQDDQLDESGSLLGSAEVSCCRCVGVRSSWACSLALMMIWLDRNRVPARTEKTGWYLLSSVVILGLVF